MNFYSFERLKILSVEDIKERSTLLNSYGYTGMLLPFGQFMGDYLTKVARAIDKDSSFEYIVAIRPHSISAQYLSMMLESINSISPKRISVNFVAGHIHQYEIQYGGLLQEPNDFSSNDDRRRYMVDYIKEFSKITFNKKYRPSIMVSGFSEDVANTVNLYADCIIMNYKMLEDDRSAFDKVTKKKMLAFSPVVRNTSLELDEFKSKINFEPNDVFYGTRIEFIDFIKKLKADGFTDIMISYLQEDDKTDIIHESIREYLLLKNSF